ncbi:hypothetical protein Efla_005544 [Eimeria flavescens]
MAATLLVLPLLVAAAANPAAVSVSSGRRFVQGPSPSMIARAAVSSFLFMPARDGSHPRAPLFACRPKPKKEKALRNYRLAKQQQQRREERLAERRQQVEVLRARQQLASSAESKASHSSSGPPAAGSSGLAAVSPGAAGASAAAPEAAIGLPHVWQGQQAARINYHLVGGTWRPAKGAKKYLRLTGPQIAAAVFQGLPEEEVAEALARAKRQDQGHMDLEAYEESETQLPTLEGLD